MLDLDCVHRSQRLRHHQHQWQDASSTSRAVRSMVRPDTRRFRSRSHLSSTQLRAAPASTSRHACRELEVQSLVRTAHTKDSVPQGSCVRRTRFPKRNQRSLAMPHMPPRTGSQVLRRSRMAQEEARSKRCSTGTKARTTVNALAVDVEPHWRTSQGCAGSLRSGFGASPRPSSPLLDLEAGEVRALPKHSESRG